MQLTNSAARPSVIDFMRPHSARARSAQATGRSCRQHHGGHVLVEPDHDPCWPAAGEDARVEEGQLLRQCPHRALLGSLKNELARHRQYATRAEAEVSIREYPLSKIPL